MIEPALHQVEREELQEQITWRPWHVPLECSFFITIYNEMVASALVGEGVYFLPVTGRQLRVVTLGSASSGSPSELLL
jgi:hypothetical protein